MTRFADESTLPLPDENARPFGPAPAVDRIRDSEPLARVACPTGITAWLVTRHAEAREVLGDPRRFSSRPGTAGHLVANMPPEAPVEDGDFFRMDGRDHVRFRHVFAPAVSTTRRMALIRPMVQRIVDDTLDALDTGSRPVNLHEEFSKPVTTAVIAELLGVPYADRRYFQRAAETLFSTATDTEDLDNVETPLFEYVYGLVVRRRAEPGTDALSILVDRGQRADRPLNDLELVKMAAGLLIAGYDTTASLISHAVLALLDAPAQFALLRDDPAAVPGAVEEVVRLLGAGGGLLRVAAVDTEIGGTPVAAGDYVVVNVQAANHDPARFADPERLDVARAENPHIGFGFGPHQCVGQHVARLELTAVLGTVPRRVPSLRLAVPFDEVEFKTETVIFGPARLPVTWDAILPR